MVLSPPRMCVICGLFVFQFSVIIPTCCSCFLLLAWNCLKIVIWVVFWHGRVTRATYEWMISEFLSLSMHFYNIYSLKDGCEMMNWVENGCLIQVYHRLLGADLCVLLVIALLQTMCSGVVIVLVCPFAACWFHMLLF
jgi:hypothetical protein